MIRLTVEEMNLLSIYHEGSKAQLMENMTAALPFMLSLIHIYIAGWSSGKELAELKGSLETIRSTAASLIDTIDGHFAEIQKAQDKEQTTEQAQPAQEARCV